MEINENLSTIILNSLAPEKNFLSVVWRVKLIGRRVGFWSNWSSEHKNEHHIARKKNIDLNLHGGHSKVMFLKGIKASYEQDVRMKAKL